MLKCIFLDVLSFQEVLAGKYNVVCTSNDKRNPRASQVELREAKYFFYRTFDVVSLKISEIFPDLIDGIKGQLLVFLCLFYFSFIRHYHEYFFSLKNK